ncbi:MAG TPA: hypothetical protein VF607_06985, partial [Verrucomicrobiae bacterium]
DHVTGYQYDDLGRRTLTTLPGGATETTLYQTIPLVGTSFLIQSNIVIGLDNKKTTLVYDVMDRPMARRPDASLSGEAAVSFGYDTAGRRVWMEDGSGHTSYAYDTDGRLTQKTCAAGTIYYTWTGSGQVSTLRSQPYGASYLAYVYDSLSRLGSLIDLSYAPQTTAYSYDLAGNLASMDYSLGSNKHIVQEFNYNEQYRLLSVTHKSGTVNSGNASFTTTGTFSYGMDLAGHRTKAVENLPKNAGSFAKSYLYDQDTSLAGLTLPRLYRLSQETWDSGQVQQWKYQYDKAGNRLSRTGVRNYTATYNVRDQQQSDTRSGQQPLFDVKGNQIRYTGNDVDGDGTADRAPAGTGTDTTADVYNFENQLKTVFQPSNISIGLVYDGDGNRVAKTTTSTSSQTTLYLVDDRNPSGYAQVLEEVTLAAAPLNGLVARWPMNEGSGTNVSDISGNGHHGVNYNGPAWQTGTLESDLNFGANAAQVQVPDKADLRMTSAMTLAFWMNMDSVPT